MEETYIKIDYIFALHFLYENVLVSMKLALEIRFPALLTDLR